MPQTLEPLRRTDQPAGATDVHLAVLAHRLAMAFGAMVGKLVRGSGLGSSQIFDDLGNDVASALNTNAVTNAQTKSGDLIAVMKSHVGDHHPANADGRQPPDRCELSGSPDLDVDRLEGRLGLLRRKFMRQSPPRRARDEAQPLLVVKSINLVDHTIDIERQVAARLLDCPVVIEHLVGAAAAHQKIGNRNTK
jgi:hypothetical protein